jgi:hypothetical protein
MQGRLRWNRREGLALGGAVALHLAIVLGARAVRVPPPELATSAAPVTPVEVFEVAMEPPDLAPSSAASPSPAWPESRARSASVPAAVNEPSALGGGALRGGGGGLAVLTAPSVSAGLAPAPEPSDGWSFSSARIATDLGAARFGGAAAANEASHADEASAPASALAATNALLDGIAAHDIATGVSRGGPLLAAVEDAAHRPDAPSLGAAVFDITVSKIGAPQVSLASASDDPGAWTKLGAEIATLTAKRQATVHLPDNAQGIRVRIRVEAVDRLADGTDVASTGKTTTNVHKGTMVRTGNVEDLPHADVAHQGRICSGRVGVNPLGPYIDGSCSPENALPPQRRVAARIVSETRL